MKTITAGDYTIEFDFDEKIGTYDNWKDKYGLYDETNLLSET